MLENDVGGDPVKIDVGSSVELKVPITQLLVQKTTALPSLPSNKRRAAKMINKSQTLNDKLKSQSKRKSNDTENEEVDKSDIDSSYEEKSNKEMSLGKRNRKVTTTKQYCFQS